MHKGRFQRLGQQRLSGNRGLSVRLGMQTIFSTAKIKLGEGGIPESSSAAMLDTARLLYSSHQAFHGEMKKGRGEKNARNNELPVRVSSEKAENHVRDMKCWSGCQVDFCAYTDKWIHPR